MGKRGEVLLMVKNPLVELSFKNARGVELQLLSGFHSVRLWFPGSWWLVSAIVWRAADTHSYPQLGGIWYNIMNNPRQSNAIAVLDLCEISLLVMWEAVLGVAVHWIVMNCEVYLQQFPPLGIHSVILSTICILWSLLWPNLTKFKVEMILISGEIWGNWPSWG